MLDVVMLAVLGVVTWCVASEGALGAGMTLLSVVFAGLLAMNFFEPLAGFLERTVALGPFWQYRWDFIALMGLFALFTFLLRLMTDHLSPTFVQMHHLAYDVGRWACGVLTGYATVAIFLTAMHTAPLPRTVDSSTITEFAGFKAEGGNFFGLSPDKQWLGFTQWVSRKSLSRNNVFDGPTYARGDFKTEEGDGLVWPSFPIRYATRREQLFAGSGAAAESAGELKPVARPSGGGAGSGGSGTPAGSNNNRPPAGEESEF